MKGYLKLPAGIKRIEAEAFAGIDRMVIEIPDSVEEIDESAFDRYNENVYICSDGSNAKILLKDMGIYETQIRENLWYYVDR